MSTFKVSKFRLTLIVLSCLSVAAQATALNLVIENKSDRFMTVLVKVPGEQKERIIDINKGQKTVLPVNIRGQYDIRVRDQQKRTAIIGRLNLLSELEKNPNLVMVITARHAPGTPAKPVYLGPHIALKDPTKKIEKTVPLKDLIRH